MAVNRFTNGAGGNTWATAGNWSQGTIPVSGDGHVTTLDATSPNCTTTGVNRSCDTLDFTGYTNTFTNSVSATLTCGALTLSATMTIAGTASVTISGSVTITSNGKTWPNNMLMLGATTKTLVGNLSVTGTLSTLSNTVINSTTAETLTVAGGVTTTGGAAQFSGTAKIIMTGGTWSGVIQNSLDLQGNVTISAGGATYSVGTLKYVSGTITVSGALVLGTSTVDTAGVSWGTVNLANPATLTINSLFSATTLTIPAQATFSGTSGFTVATLSCTNTSSATITFKEAITYTVTTSLSCKDSRVGSIVLFTSAHGTTRSNLVLPNNGTVTCTCLASFTRIDATGGRTINTFNGTITDCLNIREFHDLQIGGGAIAI